MSAVSELEPELAPGEQLLWSSRPRSGIQIGRKDIGLVVAGCLWVAFSLAFALRALRLEGPMRFAVGGLGILLILLGVYFALGRFVLEARARANTCYGITNKRVLLLRTGQRRHVRSVLLEDLAAVDISERPDGSGTLRLLLRRPNTAKVAREQRVAIAGGEVLELAPNVREAYEVLRKARGEQP